MKSLPVRGAWIEIWEEVEEAKEEMQSLPVRGAWIEIYVKFSSVNQPRVAPRAGSVD